MSTPQTPATGSGGGTATTPAGRAMVSTLLGAHAALRRDLDSLGQALRLLAAKDPAALGEVHARMDDLTLRQAAWQLKSFCDMYCQTVHAHHSIEDFRIFPAVLRIAPELRPVVDRLTADHLALGSLLDAMITSVGALPDADWATAQDAVQALADHLAAHLDLEEAHIIPQLGRLSSWI
ncbi:hemerythrin domain-containing protein [Streptomyces sp. NPDC008139]|uniref:hemerythrin domain-containing protein n=1 Tax=Streptomyces sp. NPDC008139 TaxID=3364814 RepID=UPI0036F05D2A